MFDANLRALPKGHKFFAELWACKKNSSMYNKGLRKGDVILCEMLSEDEYDGASLDVRDNPTIKVFLSKEEWFEVKSWEEDEDLLSTWLVYSGDADLTGFLPQEKHVLEKAKKVLEDFGLEGSDNE